MKRKYKLKKGVLEGIYLLSIVAMVLSLFLVGKFLKGRIYADETLSYVYRGLIREDAPVVSYSSKEIRKPFDDDAEVEILCNFYDMLADESIQEKSLILYQNTYMPNTGVLYGSDTTFDILAVLDGTVVDVVADEIIGNTVTIKHSNNLTTIYQSLNEVNVLIGDTVSQNDVIGTSGINKINSSSENMLLFEVINNGEYINPEEFYKMDPATLS